MQTNTQTPEERIEALHAPRVAAGKVFIFREWDSPQEALLQASCFLEAATASAYAVADSSAETLLYSVAYLVDMAGVIVDSAIESLANEKKGKVPA